MRTCAYRNGQRRKDTWLHATHSFAIIFLYLQGMEFTQSSEEIEHIQVDSLIWSEPQQQSILTDAPFRLFTASKSLKNAQILSHIKPDYGSLGEFMKDVGISKDILLHNRKKKLDQQEDLEQKRMRTALRGKNLQRVIRQEGPVLEKVTASKMIVEGLFQKSFGNTISNFCSQNNRQENNKATYSSINSFAEVLDGLMSRQKQENAIRRESKQELPVLARNKNQLSSKEIKIVSVKERLEKVREIKSRYNSLKRIAVQQGEEDQENILLSQGTFEITRSNSTLPGIVDTLKRVRMQEIHRLKISSAQLSDDLLCFVLDFFCQVRNNNITQLVIQDCSFGNIETISSKIKEFIQRSNVCSASLTRLGLRTKDFCVICLGIGTKSSFDYLSIKDNEIGQLAKKCLDVLMKFHKTMSFDFTNNPIQRQLKGRPAYKRCLVPKP